MMSQMRANTKWIMLITALAFVGLMVFEWGMDLTGQSSAQMSGGEVGEVNGEPVMYQEYIGVYQRLYDQRQQQDADITAVENRQLEQTAWDQVVAERLIRQEIERRGITVSSAEIQQAARYAPPPEFMNSELFQTDGQFDLEKYHQFLASPSAGDQLLLQLEAYYREMLPRDKLFQQIIAGTYISDGELWRMWREQHETARVRYIAFDPAQLVEDAAVSVTEREIATFYDENQDSFQQPARAQVRVVSLDKAPLPADTAAAQARAGEIRQQILDGADFAELARAESADEASAANGGDLGPLTRGETAPAFDQALWSLPVGELSEPVLTQHGLHLIEVQSRTEDQIEARHILIPIERVGESEIELLSQADSLEALGETMTLQAAAEQLGLSVRTAELNETLPFVPGIGQLVEGADWTFQQAQPGDVSLVYETPEAFYMLELVERTEASTLPLAQATPTIRSGLLRQKKLDRARAIARDAVDRLRDGATLAQVATANGLEVGEAGPFTRFEFVPGLGQASAAVGTAFGLEPGQTSGVVEANDNLFIIELVEREAASREAWEEQKALQRSRVTAALRQERVARFIDALKQDADIVDNREVMLNPVASASAP